MATDIVDIPTARFIAGYCFILIVLALIRIKDIRLSRDLLISAARMTVQLFIMAFVLKMVFDLQLWYIVLAIELVIFLMASQIVFNRVKARTNNLMRNVFFALVAGAGTILLIFLVVVVGREPLYDPRYVIPLGGMIIGNAMNACAIAYERFHSSINRDKKLIMTLLSYGATYKESTAMQFREALKAAFLPILITMSATGIVALPGMMTGQILSGSDPLTAVEYQITIMLAITSSNALVAFLILHLQNKEFFNDLHQLKIINM